MKYILILLVFFSSHLDSFAQVSRSFLQSDSQTNWYEINTKNFKVVYPKSLKTKAQYTLNMLEFYKPIVSKIYKSNPKKITVIIRDDMATANGFVTLAPLRSEWFHNATFSPFIGSLEWYQALAVHEYRHVVQYDHLSKGRIKYGHYLFGEQILALLLNIVAPRWYFEGDAVYAETVYSDAGRGRSPRFSARLKSLIMSEQEFNYDDLLAGSFTDRLVNLYVYGYFLVTRGVQEYGDDFWMKVSQYASDHPWNIWAFYAGFKYHSGKDFDQFYKETIKELKTDWPAPSQDFVQTKHEKYYDEFFGFKEDDHLVYLKKELNGLMELFQGTKKISEIRTYPRYSNVDLKDHLFLYAQDHPHPRYNYKEYQDIYLYHLKSKKNHQITFNKRYLHPRIAPDKKRFLATRLDDNNKFYLEILNFKGKVLKRLKPKKYETFAQAAWVSHNEIITINISPNGKKSLLLINLKNLTQKQITPPSRNNIYNPFSYKDHVYFEADEKGAINIFRVQIKSKSLEKCTDEYIQASMPSVKEDTLTYSSKSSQGFRIKSKPINCQKITRSELFKIENYISKTPSDNYNKTKPITLDEQQRFYQSKENPLKYNESTRLFSPHSWSFFGDRGFQLALITQNDLGSMRSRFAAGIISQENTPFTSLSFDYLKYYPIFNFYADIAKRNVTTSTRQNKWQETKYGLRVSLPYQDVSNYFSKFYSFSFDTGLIDVSENNFSSPSRLNGERLLNKGMIFNASSEKESTLQQIQSPLSYSLNLEYYDLKSNKDDRHNYLGKYLLSFNTPGISFNHGIKLNFSGEYRPKNESLYQLQTRYVPILQQALSRGYAYQFTSRFNKTSLNYVLPIGYPKTGLSDWIYINRIYGRIFYDYTTYQNKQDELRTGNSKGVELIIQTNTFRKLALRYGLRLVHNEKLDQQSLELFLASINL